MGTAAALGVTHGVEPDHVAGISALTGEARSARRSAAVGAHAVGIVATMGLVGGGIGSLAGVTRRYGDRAHAALEVGTAAPVFGYGVSVRRSTLDPATLG